MKGDQASVTVQLTNTDRRRPLRNVVLEDTVSNLGSAQFASRKAQAQVKTVTATYQILCRPRGIYTVGPASITVQDPSANGDGLVRHRGRRPSSLSIRSIEDLERVPRRPWARPDGACPRVQSSAIRAVKDFFTLREYQLGDNLRRVHWRSSAKRDRLMIRQLETPWQAREPW